MMMITPNASASVLLFIAKNFKKIMIIDLTPFRVTYLYIYISILKKNLQWGRAPLLPISTSSMNIRA